MNLLKSTSVLVLGLMTLGLAAETPSDCASGQVFTSSNAQAGNELLVYSRNHDGTLTFKSHLPTGGQGSGAGLGSQGAVTLSLDGEYLFVVNAQSNSVSTFALHGNAPKLTSVLASGGTHPISVTEHDGLVYVVNDGGISNVTGFRNSHGILKAVPGSTLGLSKPSGAAPAQIGFSADGATLVVTEKGTNLLTSYQVIHGGGITGPLSTLSPGQTPFGFAFNRHNRLLVTEAVGGTPGASTVSSYRIAHASPASLQIVSPAVPDDQTAACWIAITPNGRFGYVANTGSSSVSSYHIAFDGQIDLMAMVAGATGTGSAPADAAISSDGHHLFVRNGRSFTLSSFDIHKDGSLSAGILTSGLPTSAVGLAAN
ncbi:beta-propeller fold lactonase family protein [Geothrix sp. 21YS21S-2]|uniref:lactonase family protein n=1 Tax=Geothrix sp. 21YS21S-2 TaxID=3068893 RepID=UPI0027B904F7|nr:beta-propeller fold lactonase family protein [Geothrix sp. 21YS21S-2]